MGFRVDRTKGNITELEDIAIASIHTRAQGRKKLANTQWSLGKFQAA